ncbi:MAG: Ig-like domain-containing protein, partial [Pseudohongiellaceae bacterium]
LLRGDVGCLFSAPETVEFTSATGITVEITPAHDDVYRGDCTITATLVPTADYTTPTTGITTNAQDGTNTITYTVRDDEPNRPGSRPPGIGITAPDRVLKGETITFSFNVNIGIRSAKTINVSYSESADILAETPPSSFVIPRGAATRVAVASITVRTGGTAPSGSLTLFIEGGVGYIVQENLVQTLLVNIDPAPSARPTINLTPASDTGVSNTDSVTRDITPAFTLGNLVANSTIVVEAKGPDIEISPDVFEFGSGRVIRKTLISPNDGTTILAFDNPGLGGQCTITDYLGNVTGPTNACAFATAENDEANIGRWTLTITQTEFDKTPSSSGLAITLDTIVGPTANLSTTNINESLVGGTGKYVTIAVSEHSAINIDSVSNNADGGILSDLEFLRVESNGRVIFRFLYTAPVIASLPDGSDTYDDDLVIPIGGFTDLVGNPNATASNTLRIFVRVNNAHSETPTLTTPPAGGGTAANFVNLNNQSAFPVSGTRPTVADSSIMLDVLRGGDFTPVTLPPNSANPLAWATNLDLSALNDGPLILTVRGSETGGLNSMKIQAPLVKDTIAPTVTITGLPMTLEEGSTATGITVTLSEAATDFRESDLGFTGNGGPENFTAVSGTEYTFDFVAGPLTRPGTVIVFVADAAFTDAAGNGNLLTSTTHAIRITEIPATYALSPPATDIAEGGALAWFVTRSKAVVINDREPTISYTLEYPTQTAQIDPADDADFASGFTTGSGKLFNGQSRYTISVATNQDTDFEHTETFTLIVSVGGSELGRSTGTIWNDDQQPPVVVQVPTDGAEVNAANVAAFRVSGTVTSKSTTIFARVSDGVVQPGSSQFLALGNVWSGDLDLSRYADGPLTLDVGARDRFAIMNSTGITVALVKDTTRPAITIAPSAATFVLSQRTGVTFTIDDATAVTLTADDISLLPAGNGTLLDFAVTDSATVFTATVRIPGAIAARTLTIAVAASAVTDDFGNGNLLTNLAVPIITNPPLILAPTAGSYVNLANQTAFVVSGSARSGHAVSVTVSNSILRTNAVADNRFNWSVTLDMSRLPDGDRTISAVATATQTGHGASVPAEVMVVKDTVGPSVTITGVPSTMVEGDATTITVTLSEDHDDITTGNFGAGEFEGDDLSFTINTIGLRFFKQVSARVFTFELFARTFAGSAASIHVPAARFTDLAGNQNSSSTQHNIFITEAPPEYVISDTSGDIGEADGVEGGDVVFVLHRDHVVEESGGLTFTWALSYTGTGVDDPADAADINSDDYTGSVTIPNGQSTATFSVLTVDDTTFEQAEQFNIILSLSGTEVARAIGNIFNNDVPPAPVITTPMSGAYVIAANQSAFPINGTSVSKSATINFVAGTGEGTMPMTFSTGAPLGVWSAMLDLSSLPDGVILIDLRAADPTDPMHGLTFVSSLPTSISLNKETTVPVITIGLDTSVLAPNRGTLVTFTIDDATAVTLTTDDISINPAGNGILTGFTGSGTTFTATLNIAADATADFITLGVAAGAVTDPAGNASAAVSTDISIISADRPFIIAPADNSYVTPANQAALAVRGTAPPNADIRIEIPGSTLTATSSADGIGNWATTLNLSGLLEGSLVISVTHSETGQPESDATTVRLTKDTILPSFTFSFGGATSLEENSNGFLTITASEPVDGFVEDSIATTDDLRIAGNGGLRNFTASVNAPTVFRVEVFAAALMSPGTLVITIRAGAATDAAGNANLLTTHTLTVTEVPPVYTLADVSGVEGSTLNFVLNRDKPVVIAAREVITYQLLPTGQGELSADDTDFVTSTSSRVTLAAGQTSATFPVETMSDQDFEQHETFFFVLSINNSEIARATGTIGNDETPPPPVITRPLNGEYITARNQGSYTIAGTSAARQALINIRVFGSPPSTTGQIATASGGQWSSVFNLGSLTGDSIRFQVTAKDEFSTASAAATVTVTRDIVAPTISITAGTINLSSGESTTVTFTLHDPTSATLTADDISVTPAGSAVLSRFAGSGTRYTATLSVPVDAVHDSATVAVASGAVADPAGNTSPGISLRFNVTATIPIITAPPPTDAPHYVGPDNQANYIVGGRAQPNASINLTLDSTGTPTNQITETTTANASGLWSFSLDLSDAAIIDGLYEIGLTAGVGVNQRSAEAVLSVTKDTIMPTIMLVGMPATIVEGERATVAFFTNEATDFALDDITLTGSASLANFTSLSDTVYTVDLVANTFMHPGTITLAVGVSTIADLGGNDNTTGVPAQTTTALEIPPTYTLNQHPSVVEGTFETFTLRRSKTVTVPSGEPLSYTLSYAGYDIPAEDADFPAAALTGDFNIPHGQITATITVQTFDDDVFEQTELFDFVVSVRRAEVARVDVRIINNDAPPAPVISGPVDGSYINAGSLNVRVFGTTEALRGVVDIGLGPSGAAATSAEARNGIWTADINLGRESDGAVIIAAVAYEAGRGSPPSARTDITITKDTVAPTITIAPVDDMLLAGQSTTVNFTLDDNTAVTFTADDISLAPTGIGTLSGFMNRGGTFYSATFTVPDDAAPGVVTLVIPVDAVRDLANNGSPRVTGQIAIVPAAPVVTEPADNVFANVVNQNALRFVGTAPANSAVRLQVEGSLERGGVIADNAGNWAAPLDFSGFPEGVTQTVAVSYSETGGQTSEQTLIRVRKDITRPQVFIDGLPGRANTGETFTVTFSFRNDVITDFDRGDIAIFPANVATLGPFSSTDNGQTFNATFITGTDAGNASFRILAGGFTDVAGNPNAQVGLSIRIEQLPVSVTPTITAPADRSQVGAAGQSAFTVSGSCPIICDTVRIDVEGGGDFDQIIFNVGADLNYSRNLDLSGLSDGDLTISVRGSELGRRLSPPRRVTITKDTVAPVPVFTVVPRAVVEGGSNPIILDMGEETGGDFDENDLTVVGGGTLGESIATGLVRNRAYGINYTAGTPGMITVFVAANTFTDLAGNPNEASEEHTFVVLAINASPIPTIALATGSDTGDSDSDLLTNAIYPEFDLGNLVLGASITVLATSPRGDTIAKTFTATSRSRGLVFGNPGTGGQCTVTTGLTATPNSDNCFFSVSANDHNNDGVWRITVTQDEGANPATADTDRLAVTLDTTMPTVTLAADRVRLSSGFGTTITVTLSDPGTLTEANFSATGGTLSDFAAIEGSDATRYTITFTSAVREASYTASVSVLMSSYTDVAGNGNTASDRLEFPVNGATSTRPLMMLVRDTGSDDTDRIINDNTPDFVLSDLVVGASLVVEAANAVRAIRIRKTIPAVTVESLRVGFGESGAGGFCDYLNADGSVRTALARDCRFAPDFSPADPPASSANDGDWLVTATQTEPNKAVSRMLTLGLNLDTVAPTVSLAAGVASLNGSATTTVSITISEAARGLTLDDFTVAGGSLSALTGTGTSYTATFTAGDRTAIAAVSVAAGRFTDVAGNGNAVSNTLNFAVQSSDTPTLALLAASDSGIRGDNVTNDRTPSFTLGNLVVGASVSLQAIGPRGGVRQSFIATETSAELTFEDLSPAAGAGTGGVCEILDIAGEVQITLTDCTMAYSTADDGAWQVVASQTEPGKSASNSAPLPLGLDTVGPTISISADQTTIARGAFTFLNVVFNEQPTRSPVLGDFVIQSVAQGGGFVSDLTGGGRFYRVRFTAGTVFMGARVSIGDFPNRFADAAGNENFRSDEVNLDLTAPDTTPPVVSLDWGIASLAVGSNSQITLSVNEPVFGFDASDVRLDTSNDALYPGRVTIDRIIPTSGDDFDIVITAIFPGTVRFVIDAGTFTDASNNPNPLTSRTLNITGAALEITPPLPPVTAFNLTAYPVAGTATTAATISVLAYDFDDRTMHIPAGTTADTNGDWAVSLDLSGLLGERFSLEITASEIGGASTFFLRVIEYPVPTPTVDLLPVSDSGVSDSDNLTSDRTPLFSISNLAADSRSLVRVRAESPSGEVIEKELTPSGRSENVEFSSPGLGGSCTFYDSNGSRIRSGNQCQLALTSLNDGVWTITVSQREFVGTDFITSEPLLMTLDTIGPSVTLAADSDLTSGATSLAGDGSTVITATVDAAAVLTADAFRVTGGSLSGLALVAGSTTRYTMTFTAAGARTAITAAIEVAENSFGDLAGNTNPTPSNALAIVIDPIMSLVPDAPTVDLQAASDSGNDSDNITNGTEPVFSLSGLVPGATVTVNATPVTGSLKQKTLVADDTTASVGFGRSANNGGVGGTCDIISASVGLTDDDVTNCELADGGWGITAVQVNAGGSSAL